MWLRLVLDNVMLSAYIFGRDSVQPKTLNDGGQYMATLFVKHDVVSLSPVYIFFKDHQVFEHGCVETCSFFVESFLQSISENILSQIGITNLTPRCKED